MKLNADNKRSDGHFNVGDQVLLKLQPYTKSTVANRPYPKLAYKYFGPHEVQERVGFVAYKLKLPEGSMIHPVFHISQLKPFTADYTPVYDSLPGVTDLEASATKPQAIIDRRLVKKGNTAVPQVKLTWVGLPSSAEDYHVVKQRFPYVQLVLGQAASPAGGGVTPGAEQ